MGSLARVICLSAFALAAAGPVAAAETAQPPAVWDLRALYATDAAWDAERQAVEAEVPALAALKGTFADASSLEAGLERIWAVRKRLTQLDTYASLAADVDTRVAATQVRRQQSDDLRNKIEEAIAFVKPEVIALGRAKIDAFLAERPGLAKDRYQLQSILRESDHTLGQQAEDVLAAAQAPLEQPEIDL